METILVSALILVLAIVVAVAIVSRSGKKQEPAEGSDCLIQPAAIKPPAEKPSANMVGRVQRVHHQRRRLVYNRVVAHRA